MSGELQPEEIRDLREAFKALDERGCSATSGSPVPPMPDYLGAKNLAAAISRGMSHAEMKAKWIAENPGECIHEWRWHATGAGMGWCCDKCDGYHPYRPEDNPLTEEEKALIDRSFADLQGMIQENSLVDPPSPSEVGSNSP